MTNALTMIRYELAREIVFESGLRLEEGTPVEVTRRGDDLYVEIRWQESGTTGHVWAGRMDDVRARLS